MTVIIRDFEVVAEPTPIDQQSTPASQATKPVLAPTPQDLERVSRRQRERYARVRAH